MKQLIKNVKIFGLKLFVTALSLVLSINIFAQTGNIEKVQDAVNILKGIDNHASKKEAILYIKSYADNGNTYAMNALGMAYMYGIGIPANAEKAIYYLSKAGELGNVESYHNVGMMYKNSVANIPQNFEQACHWFKIGADHKSVMCSYDMGFMLYKGLGCSQNYKKAVEYFHFAADRDYTPALYMLGLCYRNGYGIERDEERGMHYLKRAGILGYMDAYEEMKRTLPENQLDEETDSFKQEWSCPNDLVDNSLISGKYQGYMILHDWSNKFIIGEKPVSLIAKKVNNHVACQLNVNEQTISFIADVDSLGYISLSDSHINLKERYTGAVDGVDYLIKNIKLKISGNSIKGNISLYSLLLQEPERPISMLLYKNGFDKSVLETSKNDNADKILVSPNPFDNQLTAHFELQERADNVVARLFNQVGMLVQVIKLGSLDEGKQNVVLYPHLNKGNYVLNIKAGKHIYRTIITKK